MKLATLQTKTGEDFEQNLKNITRSIQDVSQNSLVLAHELCLTGYAYDRLDEAVLMTQKAIPVLKALSKNRVIALTMTTKEKNHYYNTLFVFHKERIVYTQHKAKLFCLNDEQKYFTAGESSKIEIFEIAGVKIGVLICFELRFIELWQQLQGADIILVPAMWGSARKDNFQALTKALAIANQCFVLASGGANKAFAKSSAIITPLGKITRDDRKTLIVSDVDFKEIKSMRENLFVGIES